ncbi:MAG: LamG domain-containing protein [Candidatus Micrarchaeota archaeon]|nr:LamG domain-containing protein [Candidatus Micrarchaeota archaeon]MDE1858949.1 LamG domain-containing protein [Candidatus Micrarchaeota archaeon]
MKFQSAMEYLTTYGLAIFAILIALILLYGLGVFSGSNYVPKASPGSCIVQKNSYGGSSLRGDCLGAIPEYATALSGAGSVTISSFTAINEIDNGQPFSVSAWIYPTSFTTCENNVLSSSVGGVSSFTNLFSFGVTGIGNTGGITWGPPRIMFELWDSTHNQNTLMGATTLNPNNWYFIAGTYSGSSVTLYLNGQQDNTFAFGVTNSGSIPLTINKGYGFCNGHINGIVSNIQIYNASLSSNSILALYKEGIGGSPIDLQNIIGWWPLNGDTKDYSGNNGNGVGTNLAFVNDYPLPPSS